MKFGYWGVCPRSVLWVLLKITTPKNWSEGASIYLLTYIKFIYVENSSFYADVQKIEKIGIVEVKLFTMQIWGRGWRPQYCTDLDESFTQLVLYGVECSDYFEFLMVAILFFW